MNKVLLAIPTAGGIHERTSAVAARLAARPSVAYVSATGRPVDYVRNRLIRMFLNSGCSHLFFLDSDVEPPLDCLDRLLALDAPLAGGRYPVVMHRTLRWAIANKDSDGRYRLLERLPSLTEPFEADAGGAGCLLIKREVLTRLSWPWFKWVEYEDGRQMSEDIYFFKMANDSALRVVIDPFVICNHFKEVNITDLMCLKQSGKE